MNDEELKPCPLCGRKPKYFYIPGWYGYYKCKGKLECDCGLVLKAEEYSSSETLYKRLCNRWNRRAKDD